MNRAQGLGAEGSSLRLEKVRSTLPDPSRTLITISGFEEWNCAASGTSGTR